MPGCVWTDFKRIGDEMMPSKQNYASTSNSLSLYARYECPYCAHIVSVVAKGASKRKPEACAAHLWNETAPCAARPAEDLRGCKKKAARARSAGEPPAAPGPAGSSVGADAPPSPSLATEEPLPPTAETVRQLQQQLAAAQREKEVLRAQLDKQTRVCDGLKRNCTEEGSAASVGSLESRVRRRQRVYFDQGVEEGRAAACVEIEVLERGGGAAFQHVLTASTVTYDQAEHCLIRPRAWTDSQAIGWS